MTDDIFKAGQYIPCLVLATEDKLSHRPKSGDNKIVKLRDMLDWNRVNGHKSFLISISNLRKKKIKVIESGPNNGWKSE